MKGNRTNNMAHLTPERMREIASMGGKAAHAKGTAHVFSSEEARVAGSKGGRVRAENFAQRKAIRALEVKAKK